MMRNGNFKSENSGQTIVLAGFVIAVIIVGLGSILNSAAISGQQKTFEQSDESFDSFSNVREEYGIALMISSDNGDSNPFNATLILEFEDRMKRIMESHGYLLNFTWTNESYFEDSKRATVNILFSDGSKLFNDNVSYNLVTGKIIYDIIPPGDIDDLYVRPYDYEFSTCDDAVDGAILLNWTATGDDGDQGTASRYDIRYSNESIDDLFEFKNATKYDLGRIPKESGQSEDHIIELLDPGDWYFAMIVYDDAGNPSNLTTPVPNYDHAVASEWSPEIYNLSANNLTSDNENPFFDAEINDSINITFQVKDRDPGDNVTISLMVRNRTLNPDLTWDYGDWFEGKNWAMGNYSGIELFYNNITKINESWDYYFNLTDNSSCSKKRTLPFGAPDNNSYSIEIPTIEYHTVAINWTFVNDTYIDENIINQSINYGINFTMNIYIENNYDKYGFIKFNLSSIPAGAIIESANLSLFVNSSDIVDVNLYIVNYPWEEYSVNWTWFNASTYDVTTIRTFSPNPSEFTNWTVTSDIESFHNNTVSNYGWIIKIKTTENKKYVTLDSKEASNTSRRPILYVKYYS